MGAAIEKDTGIGTETYRKLITMETELTSAIIHVQKPNGDNIDFEILPSGKILQVQANLNYPILFCQTFGIPREHIDNDHNLVTCSDWLLGGKVDLGFLTKAHIKEGTLVINEQPLGKRANLIMTCLFKNPGVKIQSGNDLTNFNKVVTAADLITLSNP